MHVRLRLEYGAGVWLRQGRWRSHEGRAVIGSQVYRRRRRRWWSRIEGLERSGIIIAGRCRLLVAGIIEGTKLRIVERHPSASAIDDIGLLMFVRLLLVDVGEIVAVPTLIPI